MTKTSKLMIVSILLHVCYANTYYIFLKHNKIYENKIINKLHELSNVENKEYGNYMTNNELINFLRLDSAEVVESYLQNNNVKSFTTIGDVIIVNDEETNIKKMYESNNMSKKVLNNILHIEGLVKLNNLDKIKYKRNKQPSYGFVGREVLSNFYNFSMNSTVTSSSSLALIEFGDGGFGRSDFTEALKYNNVFETNNVKVFGQDNEEGIESSLDVQMAGMTSNNVSMWYIDYGESQWIASMGANISAMINPPNVISISYGWSERNQCQIVTCKNITSERYVRIANLQLAKLGIRGVTAIVASGDAGSPSRVNEGCEKQFPINPDFPASSPYVTSVGGSYVESIKQSKNSVTLTQTPLCRLYNCTNGTTLGVVNYAQVGWTTGGGFGLYNVENTPYWQKQLVNDYLSSETYLPPPNTWNAYGRGYPDVMMIGHNCATFLSGILNSIDGTSCSCPTFAGLVSLLNDKLINNNKSVLGFMNPLLYKLSQTTNNTFNNNFNGNTHCTEEMCCSKSFGFRTPNKQLLWNPVSGLGSPNYNNLYDLL